jgi:hypothetical protein
LSIKKYGYQRKLGRTRGRKGNNFVFLCRLFLFAKYVKLHIKRCPRIKIFEDFNPKNVTWGSGLTDGRIRTVFDVSWVYSGLFNTGANMHLCLGSEIFISLDLAFVV